MIGRFYDYGFHRLFLLNVVHDFSVTARHETIETDSQITSGVTQTPRRRIRGTTTAHPRE